MKKAVVAGFIGSYMVDLLVRENYIDIVKKVNK